MSGWKNYRQQGGREEGPRLSLLIVDDEQKILESLVLVLSDRFRVVTAPNPARALEVFDEEKPEIVLCDQRMPGGTGIELLKTIKEREPGTIRILITGYSDISVVIEALNEAVLHRYITKPWVNEELLEVVVAAARQYLEESGMAEGEAGILF